MNGKSKLSAASVLANIGLNDKGSNTVNKERLLELPIDQIQPDPSQPRKDFDQEKLKELADSIDVIGLIHPIVVKKVDGVSGYVIVVGERRWRACNMLKWQTMRCVYMADYSRHSEIPDGAVVGLMQMAENMGRDDMSNFETASRLQFLQEEFNFSLSQLSAICGSSKTTVHELLKIFGGPLVIKTALKEGVSKRALLILVNLMDIDKAFILDQLKQRKDKNEAITLNWAKSLEGMLKGDGSPEPGAEDEPRAELENTNESSESELGETDIDSANAKAEVSGQEFDSKCDDIEGEDLGGIERDEPTNEVQNDIEDESEQDENVNGSSDLDLEINGFKKRPSSKARISVKTPAGTGEVRLEYAPKEPTMICVELTTGEVVTVPFSECEIIGYE
jgi:ParB family chromosome partitioning protein